MRSQFDERFNKRREEFEREWKQAKRKATVFGVFAAAFWLVAYALVVGILGVVLYALLRWQGLV